MRIKTAAVIMVVLFVCFGAAVPGAHSEGKCSLKTFQGTYVSFEKGSSLTIDLTKFGVLSPMDNAVPMPPAWEAPGIVPFANIAHVTYGPDGEGEGYFWIVAGSIKMTPDPIPVHITITEMNEDCTGKFQYTLANGALIEERFILFDNGRQYRSVPTTLGSPGIPTLAWIGTGQRISNSSEPVEFCGSQTAHGNYLMTCDNIVKSPKFPTKAVADTFLLEMDVSMDGNYTGLLYEKLGPASIDGRPVLGTVTVNPDCSFSATLDIEGIGNTIEERGVFFNEGKEFYSMALGVTFSVCQGTRISQ